MSILLIIATVLALAVITLLALAARKPDVFKVERRAIIAAPMATVYGQIENLQAWQAWSPWAKKDPDAKSEFIGPVSGVGAAFAWDGDKNVGKGRMEIVEAVPHARVRFRLDFESPFKATNEAVFLLREVAGGTEVTWTMTGRANLLSKVLDMLLDMDCMVGRDFEAGLAAMKGICENRAA